MQITINNKQVFRFLVTQYSTNNNKNGKFKVMIIC